MNVIYNVFKIDGKFIPKSAFHKTALFIYVFMMAFTLNRPNDLEFLDGPIKINNNWALPFCSIELICSLISENSFDNKIHNNGGEIPIAERLCNTLQDVELNCIDLDMDGFSALVDCDDEDPTINPGMEEILLNGLDDDCLPYTTDTIMTCYVPGFTFVSQEQIDDFILTYDSCNVVIDGDLIVDVSSNDLVISSMNMIVAVRGDVIINNVEQCKLNNLQYIEHQFESDFCTNTNMPNLFGCNWVFVKHSDSLSFMSLKSTDYLTIGNNQNLNELHFNDSLEIYKSLSIYNNPNLASCSVRAVCNKLSDGSFAQISNNMEGCNSREQVELNCIHMDNDNYGAFFDCNDEDALINPGATEIPNNGIDED